ncbi:MAG: 2,5-diamino-6-(ribosylamino)-4(3H)-pyrimidinone 5'-phosphate reductase [Thermoplasmatales archaeon]|nr:MAG: 2,5-diamino-6-(ribosylamino)-4(3H)-pyrimidinone 5'-phosphate reductase [Thermoplasmatales archaeon]
MKRPYVIINCAMSADGKIASPTGHQLRISNEEDIKSMYNLRNSNDAVLVGVGTILSDNPKLTVKEQYVKNPRNPIRIILDTHCRTKPNSLAVDENAKTLIFANEECDKKYGDNVEIIQCGIDSEGLIDLEEMLEKLLNYEINKLMVEGGSTIIWNFLKQGFVDDLFVFIGPVIIGGKYTPSMADGEGITKNENIVNLEVVDVNKIGNGILVHYRLIK